jgi:hypothetical protein
VKRVAVLHLIKYAAKMRWPFAVVLLAFPSVVVLACGGDDTSDGGFDATVDSPEVDAGGDASVDSGHDATVDSGSDATVDAGDSGTSDSGDASMDSASDASDAGDASSGDGGFDDAGCGSKTSFGFTSDAGCGTGVDYSCGTNEYEVECTCSPGICRCKKNDAGVGGLSNFAGCPSCAGAPPFSTLAAGCGIPY